MHWIDITILAVLGLSLLFGLWRGLVNELFAIVAWIAAFIAARLFSPDMADWLANSVQSKPVILLLSWVIPFLLAFAAVNIIRFIIKSMVDIVGLKPVDRFFGGVFGIFKGGLIITAIVLIVQLVQNKPSTPINSDSRLLPHFQEAALWVLENVDTKYVTNIDHLIADSKLANHVSDALASNGALKLGLNREQLQGLMEHMQISGQELAQQLQDSEQLEQLRKLLDNPQIKSIINKD